MVINEDKIFGGGGCQGGGCSGGQCSGSGCSSGTCGSGGCSSGSCGGAGCSNDTSHSSICKDRTILDDEGYEGGGMKELIRRNIQGVLDEFRDYRCNKIKTIDNIQYHDTGIGCHKIGQITHANGLTYRCIGGTWHYADGGNVQDINQKYETVKKQEPLYMMVGGGKQPCKEEPIYDHHGCIIGYKPFLVAEGEFGIWNTSEIYPMTKNCGDNDATGDCEYVYGDLAGKNVRLFRTPSVSKEPFYIGGRDGVPNRYDGAGMEDDGAYVLMIGLRVEGITPPKNLPKPLCKVNPYTITYVERTESNKSVIANGLLINTFLGDIGGDIHAVPKIGLNSPEHYDVHINNNNTFFRGGQGDNDVPGYVFHSPDLHLRRPSLDAYRIIIQGEAHGEGFRYGLYDRGDPPENFYLDQKQQKGARAAINLSRFTQYTDPLVRCVRGMSYVRADSVMSNSDRFTYPLLNTYKESCAYIELNQGSGRVELINNGSVAPYPSGSTNFADESFVGDTSDHERILKGAAYYASVTRYIPNQYGSPLLQTYIPIGLEVGSTNGEPHTGASGLCGDSFVNGYSIKRTSYVSDKVPDVIVAWPKEMIFGDKFKWIGSLIKFLMKITGIKGYAELPYSGSEGDFDGFLHLNSRNGAANLKGQDIYYPHVVKTNIWAYFNSDSNLFFRQTGSPEIGDVHIHRLKGLRRDSSLPLGGRWKEGFLNRFYMPWDKASGFKQIANAIMLFIWVYIIGGYILIQGMNMLSMTIVGLSTSVLSIVEGILLMLVGIAWIVIWAISSVDNKLVATWLGIDLQYPDYQYSGTIDPRASNRAMREGRVVQFEDNYHKINHDYSIPNTVEKGFGMGDPYVTCLCPCEKTNKIVYSNKQLQGSHIDSWANFKTNNYLEIPADLGKIMKIVQVGGRLYAHTTDHLVPLFLGSGIDSTQLGTGSLMRGSQAMHGGVVEGVAGLLDPNASEVTGWGYIFPDREAKDWYIFNGGSLDSIGKYGMEHFFNEHMDFELLKQIPEYNLVDQKIDGGIGYSMGVDHENKYLFITKLDYTTKAKDKKVKGTDGCMISTPLAPDCNKSWTLTFDIEKKQWVGFEYYTPHLYAWNRFDMYAFNKEGMWRHNMKGSYQTFFGVHYPSVIELVVLDRRTYDDFDYESTVIDTEAYKFKECSIPGTGDYVRNPKITYDKLISYNSHQNSGEISFINNNDNLTVLERSRGQENAVRLEFKGRKWHFSEIISKMSNVEELQFECACDVGPRRVNQSIMRGKENYKWNDNHLVYRFVFSKHDDIKLFLKNVKTLIDGEIDESDR